MLGKLVIAAAFSAGSLTARPFLTGWDESFITASHSAGQGFDETPGELEVSDYWLRALAAESVPVGDFLSIQPAFDYRSTVFHFEDVPTSLPVDRDNLESFRVYPSVIELSTLAWAASPDSPWIFGAWAMAGLATDFRNLDSDDIALDVAAGAGYRFNEALAIGLGAAVTDLSGLTDFLPGIGLDWRIHEKIHVGICGPTLAATYTPDADWRLGLRGGSTREIWNITDDDGKSRYLDFESYRLGLFANRRVTEQLELSAGAGVVFGTRLGLRRINGDVLLEQDLSPGFFCQIGLVLTSW